MLGLDAAGKTSELLSLSRRAIRLTGPQAILYKLKLNQSVTTIPTGACPHAMTLAGGGSGWLFVLSRLQR